MPQTKPIVSVENVVASASVDQKIDLNEVTKKFPDTEYHPDQFPGLVFRLKTPRTATLIFRTGKMVCTGAKSEEMAIKAVQTNENSISASCLDWLISLRSAVKESAERASRFLVQYENLVKRLKTIADNTRFRPLFSEKKQLFSIGYSLDNLQWA